MIDRTDRSGRLPATYAGMVDLENVKSNIEETARLPKRLA